MFIYKSACAAIAVGLLCLSSSLGFGQSIVPALHPRLWLTDPDRRIYFKYQERPAAPANTGNRLSVTVDPSKTYQEMDGFGFALTGGSAMLIHKMPDEQQRSLLREIFGQGADGIGVSYLRISIGASDLDDHVFSYDDMPPGKADPGLKEFSLANDEKALIPVLKKILLINPHVKIMASPWSAPSWMKTNDSSGGGHLLRRYYQAYSQYFVRYIAGMKASGIAIEAVTVQNEPLNAGNNPSMVMEASEEAEFIKNDLGPDFQKAKIRTKIIVYDHNADRPGYPIEIFNDAAARKYIDGSAFHLYGGKIEALSEVHEAYPEKNLYFTEEWVGAPGNLKEDMRFHITNLIIGAPRNWCKNVIEWNLAADPQQEPHTPGGCSECLGAVTIDGSIVTRNPAYYVIAHAAKFVTAGSRRIASGYLTALPNVAFRTPEGKIVLIVYNNSASRQVFEIKTGIKTASSVLNAGATGTYVF